MDNIWYLDPIWAAQQINPELDLTDFVEVDKCARQFLSSMHLSLHSDGYRVWAARIKLVQKKRSVESVRSNILIKSFDLIHSDGIQKIKKIKGHISPFSIDEESYFQIGPFVIADKKLYNIEATFKKLNPDGFVPKKVDNDELEYIEV